METTLSENQHQWGPILSTHPLSYTEIMKRSLRLYFASFANVILFSYILALIVFLPRLISYVLAFDIIPLILTSPQMMGLLVLDIISILFLVAIFWRLHCAAHYKHESFNDDFNIGIHKVIYVFIAVIIQGLIIFGTISLTLAFQYFLYKHNWLFPVKQGISWQLAFTIAVFALQLAIILYLSILFIFLLPLIAIENEHIVTSIKRSVALTWKHWWLVFSRQITPWICFVIFSLFVRFFIGINIHIYLIGMDRNISSLPTLFLQICLFALFVIWPAALLYLQLKDLEIRKKLELHAQK